MRILALIMASTACLATDMAASGGLNTTPSETPSETPSGSIEAVDGAVSQAQATQPETQPTSAPAAKAKAKTTKAKAAKADGDGDGALANAIATALTSGDCKAVVWVMPGHEAYRPGAIVIVDTDHYGRLRDRGHARDAETGELEAAIAAGGVHWAQG